MDDYGGDAGAPASAEGVKRKRSNSPDRLSMMHAPPAKLSKTLPGAHVDFLATLPAEEPLQLVDIDDSLRFIQQHLEQYSRAIEHHESLAANLGAKLQAPNTIKRFERLFMHPMKILANHGKESNHVTWLDIVRFHEDKPNQMKLHPKDGEMVCQFYTKQCRVEITEDEYEFIKSGQPQKMLPSGTVAADEEKELGTIEFMEQKVSQIVKLSDAVSGRGRTLMSRLKARRNALAAKRESETNGTPAPIDAQEQRSASPVSGFTAINAQARDASANGITTTSAMSRPLVSPAVRQELSQIFSSNRDRLASINPEYTRSHKSRTRNTDLDFSAPPPVSTPAPATPGINPTSHKPSPAEKVDNDGPFKATMLARMDKMERYSIVRPPCDRCRRLQIDCQKNLTACLGCTRKHAKCSWKDVTDQELHDFHPSSETAGDAVRRGSLTDSEEAGPPLPVRDEELLGEDDSEDEAGATGALPGPALGPRDGASEARPASVSSASALPALSHPALAGASFNPINGSTASHTESTAPRSPPGMTPASHDLHRAIQNHKASTASSNAAANSLYNSVNTSSSLSYPSTADTDMSSQSNGTSVKVEQPSVSQAGLNSVQTLPRLPSLNRLGDQMIDNPALLGTATGDRLAREAEKQIERLPTASSAVYEPTQQQSHTPRQEEASMHGHPASIPNGTAKV